MYQNKSLFQYIRHLNLCSLLVIGFHVVSYNSILISWIITILTMKWFFSSMNHYMPSSIVVSFENHGTKLTTKLFWAQTNWSILQSRKSLNQIWKKDSFYFNQLFIQLSKIALYVWTSYEYQDGFFYWLNIHNVDNWKVFLQYVSKCVSSDLLKLSLPLGNKDNHIVWVQNE